MCLHLFSIGGKTPKTIEDLCEIFKDQGIEAGAVTMFIDAVCVGIEVLEELRTEETALQEIRHQPDYGISCPQNPEAMQLIVKFPHLLAIFIQNQIPPDLSGVLKAIRDTLTSTLDKMDA